MSDEIIISREQLEVIVEELRKVLEMEQMFQIKLRLTTDVNRNRTFSIIPHCKQTDILL